MKTSKARKGDAAIKVAMAIAKERLSLQEIYYSISDTVDTDYTTKIAEAIHPGSKKLEETGPWLARQKEIEDKLDPEGVKLFHKYDSDWCDRDWSRTVAAFYLGFATASTLGATIPMKKGAKRDRP